MSRHYNTDRSNSNGAANDPGPNLGNAASRDSIADPMIHVGRVFRRIGNAIRAGCPSLVEIERLILAGLNRDLAEESVVVVQRAIATHVYKCDACRQDFRLLLRGYQSQGGLAAFRLPSRSEAIKRLKAQIALIEGLDEESWRRCSHRILGTIADSTLSIAEASEGKGVRLPPVDRFLARELSRLRKGDAYRAITRIGDFWVNGVNQGSTSMLETEFFAATAAALIMGVRVERIFPLHIDRHRHLIERLLSPEGGAGPACADADSPIPELLYFFEHLELEKRIPGYELRLIFVTGPRERETLVLTPDQEGLVRTRLASVSIEVRHCGICCTRTGNRDTVAFTPTYDPHFRLMGLALLNDEVAREYAVDFADLWGCALPFAKLRESGNLLLDKMRQSR